MLTLLLPLFSSPAHACPTIATGTPSGLLFDVAQVAIVRQDGRTTFSVSINPVGDTQEFALVMPVPTVLAENEVKTLDGAIFGRLDGYSAPRHVADAGCGRLQSGGSNDTGAAADGDGGIDGGDGTVDVEATYLVGDYEVVILSAEESMGLETWLTTHGYHLPDGADARLAEYIESGSFFLAAKVAPGADLADGSALAPLQISYLSDGFTIPLRLATLNSPGEQDMVIYAITESQAPDGGRVGIANYPEFTIPDKCMWDDPSGNNDFTSFYEDAFDQGWLAMSDAAWTVEFAGEWGSCNPCSGVNVDEADLAALGFTGDAWDHHLTRIRARYTPEQATQDLVLYGSGLNEAKVTSFADLSQQNAQCIDSVCFAEDEEEDRASNPPLAEHGCGCETTPASGAAFAGGLAAAALVRRKRWAMSKSR
ncbi:hypothetical protein LBMAG42_34470 [Deltaproteobacteria bacterium]|nr:hypothetical protein LBMAG42_34470 [Deltaproteobacteria bacterium]